MKQRVIGVCGENWKFLATLLLELWLTRINLVKASFYGKFHPFLLDFRKHSLAIGKIMVKWTKSTVPKIVSRKSKSSNNKRHCKTKSTNNALVRNTTRSFSTDSRRTRSLGWCSLIIMYTRRFERRAAEAIKINALTFRMLLYYRVCSERLVVSCGCTSVLAPHAKVHAHYRHRSV